INPSIAYLGVYFDAKRWTKAKITLKSPKAFRILLDGKIVATKSKIDKSENGDSPAEGRKVSADITLETGKHLLLVKTVSDPGSNADWTLKAFLSYDEKFAPAHPTITLSTKQHMTITHLLDGPKVSGISVSPDGTLAALSIRKTLPPSDASETWVEMYRTTDGCLTQTYRGGTNISRVNWAPSGKKFSYTTRDKSRGAIWIVDLKTGTSFPILKNIQDLGMHVWSPDSSFILYSVTEKAKSDKRGVKRFKNLADRQPYWRDRSFLHKVTIPDGVRQRLTAGEFSTSLNSISPDGKNLLFTRSIIDYSERPYSKTELFCLDLETLETQLLWSGNWFNSAQWDPQGKRILILGGPSIFENHGINI
ncbi:MAG: PD40 domain-containing protein, partial [Candidatus Aminicenantes bacterium]|nr:PD40 domain-containing protein [Candidatus Aminicenantes bacterium]